MLLTALLKAETLTALVLNGPNKVQNPENKRSAVARWVAYLYTEWKR